MNIEYQAKNQNSIDKLKLTITLKQFEEELQSELTGIDVIIEKIKKFQKAKNTHKYLWKKERPGQKPLYKYPTFIKQPKGKENKTRKQYLSIYEKKVVRQYPYFFKNHQFQKSFSMFKEHIRKNPDYFDHLGKLSILEALTIYHYSLKWGYRKINSDVKSNKFSKYTETYYKILNSALDKLPSIPYGTTVYRGGTLNLKKLLKLEECMKNNIPYKFNFFTSVGLRFIDGFEYMTKSRGKIREDERLVLFYINPKNAKNVTKLRWREKTQEAIIQPQREFIIIDMIQKKDFIEIYMEEI